MFHYRFLRDCLAFLSVLFLSTLLSFSATAPTALSAGEIIKKTIARAQATRDETRPMSLKSRPEGIYFRS